MRLIAGIAGCKKGLGSDELETKDDISVRIIDTADDLIAIRVGTNIESARLTQEQARHLATLLDEAADRIDDRIDDRKDTAELFKETP